MLRQNINLYNSFKTNTPQLKYLNWRQLILGSTAFLILLILSYLINLSNMYYEKYQLADLNNQVIALQTTFENKKKLYPPFFFSDNVAKTVGELEKSMAAEADLLEKIANRISFSDILLALARIDAPNGWVTAIAIKDGGNDIQLSGEALTMTELKIYFANIVKDEFFKKDHLTVNKLEHTPKEAYPDFQEFIISIAKVHHEKPNL